MATNIETEKQRRLAMWSDLLAAGGPNGVQPSLLRQLRIYGGAQGIWVDRQLTSSVEDMGITVGLLHTGVHYPDELVLEAHQGQVPKSRRRRLPQPVKFLFSSSPDPDQHLVSETCIWLGLKVGTMTNGGFS